MSKRNCKPHASHVFESYSAGDFLVDDSVPVYTNLLHKAIAVDHPLNAEANCNLGHAYRDQDNLRKR